MLNRLRYLLKKNTNINVFILRFKFFFKFGLDPEAKFIHKSFNFNTSLDVGSNSGHVTNMLSKICKNVYSFEPIDYLYRAQKKIFKNRNIKVYNYALGDKKCKKIFYISKNNDPESSFLLRKKSIKKKSVKINTGDSIFRDKRVDFIKIDVEGYEYHVIKGLENLIKKHKPLLLIEIEKRHNSKFKEIFNFFRKKNYKIYFLSKKKDKLKFISYSNVTNFINQNQNLKFLGSDKYINNFFFIHSKNYFFENR
jgi:FkbM family methyltransferase